MEDSEKISSENYSNWFALYYLCQNIGSQKAIHMNSVEFGKILNLSQQTASRRINDLEDLGWIERKIKGKEQVIRITKKGGELMLLIYKSLKQILQDILVVGVVTEGIGEGGYYVRIPGYLAQFEEKLGYKPYFGTLNLQLSNLTNDILEEKQKSRISVKIDGFKKAGRTYGSVECYKCVVSRLDNQEKKLDAVILKIKRTYHKKNIVEILAKPYLRDKLKLKDGDRVRIQMK